MEHPLENYRAVGKSDFSKSVATEFWGSHFEEIESTSVDEITTNKEAGTISIIVINSEPNKQGEFVENHIETLSGYFENKYDELEIEAQNRLDELAISMSDKIEAITNNVIKELKLIASSIELFRDDTQFENLQNLLLEKVQTFTSRIEHTYLKPSPISSINTKIKWVGNTNLLGTLIFDLWQGQDKGVKKPKLKHLIEADKKTLMKLLLNHFIDKNGYPLKESSFSDYLNTAEDKNKMRAKEGIRIELTY